MTPRQDSDDTSPPPLPFTSSGGFDNTEAWVRAVAAVQMQDWLCCVFRRQGRATWPMLHRWHVLRLCADGSLPSDTYPHGAAVNMYRDAFLARDGSSKYLRAFVFPRLDRQTQLADGLTRGLRVGLFDSQPGPDGPSFGLADPTLAAPAHRDLHTAMDQNVDAVMVWTVLWPTQSAPQLAAALSPSAKGSVALVSKSGKELTPPVYAPWLRDAIRTLLEIGAAKCVRSRGGPVRFRRAAPAGTLTFPVPRHNPDLDPTYVLSRSALISPTMT